jgi:hypothetical protein
MDKDIQPKMEIDGSGDKVWQLDGAFHRTAGPAIEYSDGSRDWYLHGNWLPFDKWLKQTTGLTDEEKVMMKLRYG